MSGIKTTKKNHIYIVQKRVGKSWHRNSDALFALRKNARECSRELNALGKGKRHYRVRKMIVAP